MFAVYSDSGGDSLCFEEGRAFVDSHVYFEGFYSGVAYIRVVSLLCDSVYLPFFYTIREVSASATYSGYAT